MDYSIEEIIRKRKSSRVYNGQPLSDADRDKINEYIAELCAEDSPFPAQVRMTLLETNSGTEAQKLGTYGVIHGAKTYIGVTVKNTGRAMEAVGYTFEKLVLYAESIGLGTCWLAGTFDRKDFTEAVRPGQDELFPIVSPIGYPSKKGTVINSLFRKGAGSDRRKAWPELFFEGGFDTPLTPEQAGEYALPLEMVRLAPSAANRQPWRIVRRNGAFHFYREANPKGKYPYDLQSLDVGIAACHFQLSALDGGLHGEFALNVAPSVSVPDNLKYLFSWVEG